MIDYSQDMPMMDAMMQPMAQPMEEPEAKQVMGNMVGELRDNARVANKIIELYDDARQSMEPWLKKYKRALNLAKLQAMAGDHEIESKSFPFEGASVVMLPYILEAMLDFQSRAAPELVWSEKIVSAKVYGQNTKEKEDRMQRVSDYMNYQLKEMIPNWREDQDKGLLILPCIGTFYKETCFDYDLQEVTSELRLADEVIFNHNYRSFSRAPDKFTKCRYTRNEVISFIRGEQGWELDESKLEEDKEDFEFIKAYTCIDVDEDGVKEPYIAIIDHEQSQRVVALYPCYDDDDIIRNDAGEVVKIEGDEYFTPYHFLPDPEGGPMGMGWGILLGPMFDAINTSMRQLIDSGTLANTAANSGLITQAFASGRGNATKAGPIDVVLGQLTPVPSHGTGTLKDNVIQFPFAGPSQTLFQLLEYLIQSARQMTNAAVNVEASPGEAASLYLARLQQGLKIPNSIIMRVYNSAKREFQKIGYLNHEHYDNDKYNKILDAQQAASMQHDFDPDDCDIRMVADPTAGSDLERVQRNQAIFDLASTQTQQVINYREAVLNLLESMHTPDIEMLAPEPDPNAVDPQQQLFMAQQAAEMELRKEDQHLRALEITLKKQKMALDAAREMSALGLQADKQEAEIAKIYAETLEHLFKAGVKADLGTIKQIEGAFIDRANPVQEINAGTGGLMAGSPSNASPGPMPGMEGGPSQGSLG